MSARKQRNRRTQTSIFIDTLKKIGRSTGGASRKALSDALNWENERFERVIKMLLESNDISITRGGGGGIIHLLEMNKKERIKLFISYSHKDKEFREELDEHLKFLNMLNYIDIWHDQEISPGDDWDRKISEEISKSDIIILIVSPSFLASPYCFGIELEQAMENHELGKSTITPIILKECLWRHAPFAQFQVLPDNGCPIDSFKNRQHTLTNISEKLMDICKKHRANF